MKAVFAKEKMSNAMIVPQFFWIFYRPIVVKQKILLLSPPQTKAKDERYSLRQAVWSSLQNACANYLGNAKQYWLLGTTANCFDYDNLYTQRGGK